MSTYLGYDVLEVGHNMRESIRHAFDRVGTFQENPTGRRFWDDSAGQPQPVRTFSWFADGRANIAVLRAFLNARRGRVVPFWTPTYVGELKMSQDASSLDSSLRILNIGYTRLLFQFSACRYLAIVSTDGTFLRRKVTLATDNGDGTETLALDSGLGIALAAARTVVSFLVLCRLEEDMTSLSWDSPLHVEATIGFRALPKETPAP